MDLDSLCLESICVSLPHKRSFRKVPAQLATLPMEYNQSYVYVYKALIQCCRSLKLYLKRQLVQVEKK